MNCKNCTALRWHPNKGFYCTVPNCNPTTSLEDVCEIMEMSGLKQLNRQLERIEKNE